MTPLTLLLLVWTGVMTVLRVHAARVVDFGDSEALYASYALFPAPSYLDHPGLVGQLYASFGVPPQASDVHLGTACMAGALPWLLRQALIFAFPNGSRDRATMTALVFAVLPVVAVGLFALTPDWPLTLCLIGGFAFAMRAEVDTEHLALHRFAAGVAFAFAGFGKVTGYVFLLALLGYWLWRDRRLHAGFVGAVLGLLPSVRVLLHEQALGFPMLQHRLGQAPTWRGMLDNLVVLLVGQLIYLSPLAALLVIYAAAKTLRKAGNALPWISVCVVGVVLTIVAARSPKAEPHWLAPLLVPIAFAATRSEWTPRRPRLFNAALGLAAACSTLVYLWVLVPASARLLPADSDPRYDLANELTGQRSLQSSLLRLATELAQEGNVPVFVGPHWTVCAKLRLALPLGRYDVGCNGPERDDFDTWMPRERWRTAPIVVAVSDDRFDELSWPGIEAYSELGRERVRIFRAGRVARTLTLRVLAIPVGAAAP